MTAASPGGVFLNRGASEGGAGLTLGTAPSFRHRFVRGWDVGPRCVVTARRWCTSLPHAELSVAERRRNAAAPLRARLQPEARGAAEGGRRAWALGVFDCARENGDLGGVE
jgi:hypothetical protein